MNQKTNSSFHYGQDELSSLTALQLANGVKENKISEKTQNQISENAEAVQDIVKSQQTVYGINTGFGPLCQTAISQEDTRKLQDNILRSHSVGVGDPISLTTAKLMLILKVHALSQGYSGVQLSTIERILFHIENDLIPFVPCQGSVGASGDLAPLAHLFLPLIGLGQVWHNGKFQNTSEVFRHFNLEPLTLGPKEGLALINGTQFIAAHAVQVVDRLQNCLDAADIIGALSLEAMLGSIKPFHQDLHNLRPYAGTRLVANRMRGLLKGSELVASHANCNRVQDPYSLRCIPQVHGTSREAWLHLKKQTLIELNSVTDNPIVFHKDHTISGGNFHGQPLALPLDYATLAASELGNISERRTYLLLEGKVPNLPTLLMKNTGINSGFMIPQYTSAALVSENKSLCYPASADSIPTSLGQEDHVSMGSISGRKALQVIGNLENILAIELLCAAQAFDFHRPLKSSPILESVHNLIRQKISHAEDDRVFSEDMQKACALITSKELVQTAHNTAQKEKIDLNGDFYEDFGLY